MNPMDPNLAQLELIAKKLGDRANDFVFVGGCAVGLLISDHARPPVRATMDVDVIAEVATLAKYYELQGQLKALGFTEDPEVICRWRSGEVRLDVMPANENILGFTNVWYEKAAATASAYSLPSGQLIRLISPPLLIATKLVAFHGRGKGDYAGSHDIEDMVTIVDGRHELIDEIGSSDVEVRTYLVDEFDTLLGTPPFVDALPSHFLGDAANQGRVPIVLERMRKVAGF